MSNLLKTNHPLNWICSKCQTENYPGDSLCRNCGDARAENSAHGYTEGSDMSTIFKATGKSHADERREFKAKQLCSSCGHDQYKVEGFTRWCLKCGHEFEALDKHSSKEQLSSSKPVSGSVPEKSDSRKQAEWPTTDEVFAVCQKNLEPNKDSHFEWNDGYHTGFHAAFRWLKERLIPLPNQQQHEQ